MTKVFTTTIALTLALALTVPAHAQLLHGGGFGGGFGGGLGGGLPIGGGIVGGGGINGTVAGNGGTFRTTDHVTTRTPKPPKNKPATATTALTASAIGTVHAPSLSAAPVTTVVTDASGRIVNRVGVVGNRVEGNVMHIVVVPAIPALEARRTAIIASGIAPVAYDAAPAYIDTQYQVLQNDLRGSGVEVVKRGQQIVLEMPSDVTFAFDKYDIQPRFHAVLDSVAQTLSKYPATYIDVDGHTDAIGSMEYNQKLSEQRAFGVANYLSERAVTPARLHVEGFGKTEPIASNATVTGRAANRRVEIVLTPYTG